VVLFLTYFRGQRFRTTAAQSDPVLRLRRSFHRCWMGAADSAGSTGDRRRQSGRSRKAVGREQSRVSQYSLAVVLTTSPRRPDHGAAGRRPPPDHLFDRIRRRKLRRIDDAVPAAT